MYHSTLNSVKDRKTRIIDIVTAYFRGDKGCPRKEYFLEVLDEKAKALGADGIIGIRFSSTSTWGDDCGERYPNMIAYGTAIKFED